MLRVNSVTRLQRSVLSAKHQQGFTLVDGMMPVAPIALWAAPAIPPAANPAVNSPSQTILYSFNSPHAVPGREVCAQDEDS